ncbi:MAG: glutaredoxin domain-containing protein [Candidatus Nanoarchaeia archaeon]|nr:glutaredoxin domain-containing protein [Candidatus Nanoarchaeia archaeon]
MKIIVYSTDACPWCYKVKQYLKEKGVAFTEYNVGEDRKKAEEMVEKSGQMSVPVTDIDGEIILGFNKEAIDGALKKSKLKN